MSPTQRTMAELKKRGYRAGIVEKRIPRVFITQDLYGIIDVLGMKPGEPLLAVQCTTNANLASRIAKHPETVRDWLSTGNRLEFWGWAKKGPRGKRKLWTLTVRSGEEAAALAGKTHGTGGT